MPAEEKDGVFQARVRRGRQSTPENAGERLQAVRRAEERASPSRGGRKDHARVLHGAARGEEGRVPHLKGTSSHQPAQKELDSPPDSPITGHSLKCPTAPATPAMPCDAHPSVTLTPNYWTIRSGLWIFAVPFASCCACGFCLVGFPQGCIKAGTT